MRQPRSGYRAGGDPAFLAAMVNANPGDHVLDLGAGVGTAGLCVAARLPGVLVDGLELQANLAALAEQNVTLNGFQDRFRVFKGDVAALPDALTERPYDWVITNPPWTQVGRGTPPPDHSKAAGHMEAEIDLGQWLKAAVGLLRHKGRLALIHRADRVDHILQALGKVRLGEVRLMPLFPRQDVSAIRVIVTARKGINTPAEMLPGLVLHTADGSFTDAAKRVLEQGAPLC